MTITHTCQHPKGSRTPYTYLIGWSVHNKWYYGSRYGNNCHPSDLWVTYFTSSKVVKSFRKEFGEPDIISARKIFSDVVSCKNFEDKVLKRIKSRHKTRWSELMLNIRSDSFRGIDTSRVNYRYGKTNPIHALLSSEESRASFAEKISIGYKRTELTTDKAKNQRAWFINNLKINNPNKFHDPEVVKKAALSRSKNGTQKIEFRPIVLHWIGVKWVFISVKEAKKFCEAHRIPKWSLFRDGETPDKSAKLVRLEKITTNEKHRRISKLNIWVSYTNGLQS